MVHVLVELVFSSVTGILWPSELETSMIGLLFVKSIHLKVRTHLSVAYKEEPSKALLAAAAALVYEW